MKCKRTIFSLVFLALSISQFKIVSVNGYAAEALQAVLLDYHPHIFMPGLDGDIYGRWDVYTVRAPIRFNLILITNWVRPIINVICSKLNMQYYSTTIPIYYTYISVVTSCKLLWLWHKFTATSGTAMSNNNCLSLSYANEIEKHHLFGYCIV